MTITQTHEPRNHWNYFLALESDCEKLARYIEFTDDNYCTYSIELAHLLIAAASEVDVVAKLLCKQLNPSSRAENIHDYNKEIIPAFPKIQEMKVSIPRHSLSFAPWLNWRPKQSPFWWRAYNNVKHERDTYFHEANLQHALNALGGLLILLLYLHQDEAKEGKLAPPPSFFLAPIREWTYTGPKLPCFDL